MKQYSIFKYNQKGWENEFFVTITVQKVIRVHDLSEYIGIGAHAINDDFSTKNIRLGTTDKDVTVVLEPTKELGMWAIEDSTQENLQYLYGESLSAALKGQA